MTDGHRTEREIIDAEHLKLLSLFNYVLGGLHVLVSCFLIFHILMGMFITIAPHAFGDGRGPNGPPTWVGLLMTGLAGCFMLLGWLFGGLTIYSGISIRRRHYRTFSLVMAVLQCLSFPFGTAVGVFTLLVLARPSVKKLYDAPSEAAPQIIAR